MYAKLGADAGPGGMQSKIYHQKEGLGIYCSASTTAECTELVGGMQDTSQTIYQKPSVILVAINVSNITECTDSSSAHEIVLNSAWHWYGPI